ncbi:MAG: TIGR01440 family protein [Oscillospiraceae bacterium]|nr:MAG: TIGR01440 family protein [Oscillospiraceae bacterium]
MTGMEPDKMELERLQLQAADAARELLEKARVPRDGIVVVGCSTSEVVGGIIGKASSMQAAAAIYRGIAPVLAQAGVFLAAQCCEHLNRAVIVERAALKPWQQPVNVLPQPHAGGSFATTAWQSMKAPAALEEIEADAGLDIGGTLIGMHLKRVAVPVRLSVRRLGQANLVAARTRPKFIGGARAAYLPEEELR